MFKYYIKHIRYSLLLEMFFGILYSVSNAAVISLIGNSLSFQFRSVSEILALLCIILVLCCASVTFYYLQCISANHKEKSFYLKFRGDLFSRMIDQNSRIQKELNIDEFISSLDNDTKMIYHSFIVPFSEIILNILYLIVYMSFLIRVNVLSSFIVILCSILCTLVPMMMGSKYAEKKEQYLKQRNEFTSKMFDFISAIIIYDKSCIDAVKNKMNQEVHSVTDKLFLYGTCRAKNISLIAAFSNFNHVLLFLLIVYLLSTKNIFAGSILIIFEYYTLCGSSIESIIRSYNDCRSVKEVEKRITEKYENRIDEVAQPIKNVDYIELNHVSSQVNEIQYKDLKFEKGKSYLLVGKNGAGKSSLLKILYGIYPYRGDYKINSFNVEGIDLSNTIAYCGQENYIFEADFTDNVTLFKTYSLKGYEQFIDAVLKNHRNIKECTNCLKLSEGEKQIISIIRTLVMNKQVMILDEPFSNLELSFKIEICKRILERKSNIVIVVDHNYKEISAFFDQIIYLN